MEPSRHDVESRSVARHLVYLDGRVGRESSAGVVEAAGNYYGNRRAVHELAAELCRKIRELTDDQANSILYDGRNADARALADWWDAHEAADAAREVKEAAEARRREAAESARAKLTDEEFRALKG